MSWCRTGWPFAALVVVSSLAACSDRGAVESGSDERFESVCGQDGPVELLTAHADEEVALLARVPGSDELHVRIDAKGERQLGEPPDVRYEAVIDECGGEIAELPTLIRHLQWRGGALFGCTDEGLVWLRGYDDPSPSLLARRCATRDVGDSWVAIDGDEDAEVGRLVRIDIDGSSVTVRPIVDELPLDSYQITDDEIFVQTPALAIDRVDPRTGAREQVLERAGADQWSIRDGLIAYQLPSTDPEVPGPLVVVRDRATGVEQTVVSELPVDAFGWYDEGLFYTVSVVSSMPYHYYQWFELDPVRELEVPEDAYALWRQDDGMIVLRREDLERGTLEMLVWDGVGAPRTMWSCASCRSAVVERTEGHEDILIERWDPQRTEVWRFELAGGPPLQLGSRLGAQAVLDDGRILAVLVDETSDHGPLLLSSGRDDIVPLVADVSMRSIQFSLGLRTPGEVAYDAIEADGSSTLHRARLAL